MGHRPSGVQKPHLIEIDRDLGTSPPPPGPWKAVSDAIRDQCHRTPLIRKLLEFFSPGRFRTPDSRRSRKVHLISL